MTEFVLQKLSPDVAFQEAISHHQAGRLKEAEQLYRSILKNYPSHPDTNHNLGILAAQVGQVEVSLPFFKAAFTANPTHAQFLFSYANALLATGLFQDAHKIIIAARQSGLNTPELKAVQQKIDGAISQAKKGAQPTQIELKQLVDLYSANRYADLEAKAHKLIEKYPYSGLVWKMMAAALQSQGKNSLLAKRKAAQFLPADADLHYNLGNEFYAQGFIKEAEQSFRNAIQIDPRHIDAYGNLGVLLNKLGLVNEAVVCYKKMVEIKPDFLKAHYILGGLLSNLEHHDEAVLSCKRALKLQANSVEALCNLGLALQGLGQLDEAAKNIRQAIEINPAYVDAYINLGNVLSELGQLPDAKACYDKALELQPDSALAHYNLASMLHDEREFKQAEFHFKRSLQINPNYANAYTNLGTTLMELGKCEEALMCYQRALLFKPESAQALCNVGSAFHELGKLDESVECYTRALKFDADFADAHGNLGGIFMQLGKIEEATAYLNKALELDPLDARILTTALIYLPFDPNSPRFAELEGVYERRATLAPNVRISFCIAYGKAMESIGQYDKSFLAYEEGNRLHYQDNPFDEVAEDHAINHMLKTMTKWKFEQLVATPLPTDRPQEQRVPIFIVGMQRSGSTLIEQILSSHPEIHGAGELMILGSLAGRADRLIQESTDDAATLLALRQLGDEYLEEVWKNAPDVRYVIDKMPHNFYFVGLIHLMFPQAKIIHSIRDPIDTCFSGYALRFGAANEFTYDLETLGRYYKRYQKLMQHWHQALPESRILDVHYEENVANPEQEARRMVTYLGLPWDPSCLNFHQNKRTVRTASVTQVRKPIYSSSVARWKHFEKHLGPLISILQSDSVAE